MVTKANYRKEAPEAEIVEAVARELADPRPVVVRLFTADGAAATLLAPDSFLDRASCIIDEAARRGVTIRAIRFHIEPDRSPVDWIADRLWRIRDDMKCATQEPERVHTATGWDLDHIGFRYDIERRRNETDDRLRRRILAAMYPLPANPPRINGKTIDLKIVDDPLFPPPNMNRIAYGPDRPMAGPIRILHDIDEQ